ncbi:hypothetical protein [Kitasatospora sp. NPDC057015]|uniref:hypothetical protein n=1 Tax=Kitasatospora sp. NPDC057015 TaxID=3346001 RepID=UPI003637155E
MDLAERLAGQEQALDELLDALGLPWQEEQADERVALLAERQPHYPRYHRIGHKRQLAYRALEADRALAARHYERVLAALLRDDDPSSPRWLATALVAAVGRRRVLTDLVRAVEDGTPGERHCAAGAWRWAEPPLRYASDAARREGRATASSLAERDSLAELTARFRAAAG